jgi:hypothetical protein
MMKGSIKIDLAKIGSLLANPASELGFRRAAPAQSGAPGYQGQSQQDQQLCRNGHHQQGPRGSALRPACDDIAPVQSATDTGQARIIFEVVLDEIKSKAVRRVGNQSRSE